MDAHRCLEFHQGVVGKDAEVIGSAMNFEPLCGRACVLLDEIVLESVHFGSRIMELKVGREDVGRRRILR
jgi:hypothetical protein